MTAYSSKKECRNKLMAVRQNLDINAISKQICEQLALLDAFESAIQIAIYLPIWAEVDLTLLIKKHSEKTWYLPRVEPSKTQSEQPSMVFHHYRDGDPLIESKWGIPEPENTAPELSEPSTLDIIIVPALAYTDEGYRLGYGKGFYDRFIEQSSLNSAQPPLCMGVVPEALLLDSNSENVWPIDHWDKPVSIVITESMVVKLN